MRKLSAKVLLDAWERCLDEPVALRASTLLAVATGEATPLETAQWTIGRRDAALISLREQLFGSSVEAIVPCPNCGEQSEIAFPLDQIRVSSGHRTRHIRTRTLRVGGQKIRYRAPNSEDLLAIAHLSDTHSATNLLLKRCVEIGANTCWRHGERGDQRGHRSTCSRAHSAGRDPGRCATQRQLSQLRA